MNAGVVDIGYVELFAAATLMLVADMVSWRLELGLIRRVAVSPVRVFVQLFAAGLLLPYLFQYPAALHGLHLELRDYCFRTCSNTGRGGWCCSSSCSWWGGGNAMSATAAAVDRLLADLDSRSDEMFSLVALGATAREAALSHAYLPCIDNEVIARREQSQKMGETMRYRHW